MLKSPFHELLMNCPTMSCGYPTMILPGALNLCQLTDLSKDLTKAMDPLPEMLHGMGKILHIISRDLKSP